MTSDRRPHSARARQNTLPRRVCVGCGSEFVPARGNQQACRPACRAAASRQARVSQYRALRAGLDALFGVGLDGDDDE
jgi:hypothetical protein